MEKYIQDAELELEAERIMNEFSNPNNYPDAEAIKRKLDELLTLDISDCKNIDQEGEKERNAIEGFSQSLRSYFFRRFLINDKEDD